MGASAAFIFPATLSTLTVVFETLGAGQGLWRLGRNHRCRRSLGPIAGGATITHYWYGSIFLVNVPLALLGSWRSRRRARVRDHHDVVAMATSASPWAPRG